MTPYNVRPAHVLFYRVQHDRVSFSIYSSGNAARPTRLAMHVARASDGRLVALWMIMGF